MPRTSISRRGFLATTALAGTGGLHAALARSTPAATKTPQRVCVILFDGFGPEYYEASPMPTLKAWAKDGFAKQLKAAMPTVTNTQAAGLCCGVHADEHGITGNSYWDAERDEELFMSDSNLLTAATMFQRAARFGVRSAMISAKQKTVSLLKQGTSYTVGSQQPPDDAVKRYGKPPDIYSPDVNYWAWKVAIDLIKNHPKFGLLFVHTTDYPMHKFTPESADSRAHLSKIDSFLKEASEADPDMAFIIAPDHGMNSKHTVVNLNLALTARGTPVKIAMSAERDQYPRHHGGYGGTNFIYLKDPRDADKVTKSLHDIEGVELVLTRDEAAKKFRLNPHRIGDLWVNATKNIVFGHSMKEREELPKDYRSHGSLHEQDIPCFIYRFAGKLPDKSEFTTNVDMAKFLYQEK